MQVQDKKKIANELNYNQVKLGMLRADLFRSSHDLDCSQIHEQIIIIESEIDKLQNMLIAGKEVDDV